MRTISIRWENTTWKSLYYIYGTCYCGKWYQTVPLWCYRGCYESHSVLPWTAEGAYNIVSDDLHERSNDHDRGAHQSVNVSHWRRTLFIRLIDANRIAALLSKYNVQIMTKTICCINQPLFMLLWLSRRVVLQDWWRQNKSARSIVPDFVTNGLNQTCRDVSRVLRIHAVHTSTHKAV